MDAERRSAMVGTVLGAAVVAMGAVIFAMGVRWIEVPDSKIHVPRWMLAAAGIGVASCGASFAAATCRSTLARALATVGIALTFVLPLSWIALGPGIRECVTSLSFGFFTVQRATSGWICRGAFGLGAFFSVAILIAALGSVVKPWAPPAWSERIEKSSESAAALVAGAALLVLLGIAAPLLAARWAALRAYARLTGSADSRS